MGCWNQTCAVTKTAIQSDQPCRLIFIAESERISEAVTSVGAVYRPIDTFISGIYKNDDGFPHFVDEKEIAHFQRVTEKLGFPVFDDDEVYQYERLMGRGHLYCGRKINFCVISETVFEHLAPDIEALKVEFTMLAWPDFLAAIEREKDGFEFCGVIIKASPRDIFDRTFKRGDEKNDSYSHELSRFLSFGWGAGSSVHYLASIFPEDSTSVLERIHEFIEVWIISEFLDLTRGMWSPQGGQGSQEINSKKQYNKLIDMISERIADDVNNA